MQQADKGEGLKIVVSAMYGGGWLVMVVVVVARTRNFPLA
jgi:hypothetical protein